ncbi:MAG: glycosyl hydrolase, partial [Sphingobacteriia bacterium]
TIMDKAGKPIKTFSKNAREAADKIDFKEGLNQFVWDQNYPGADRAEGMILWNGVPGAVKAAPGNYTARIRFNQDSVTVPFTIVKDPAYAATEADYDAQVAFLLQVRDKFNEVQTGIKNIRSVRTQINDLNGRLDSKEHKAIKQAGDSLVKQLTAIEEALYQTKSKSGQDVLNFPIRINDKLGGLYGVAASGQNAPSAQVKEVFADLGQQADVQLNKLKALMGKELKALNAQINQMQVPVIGVK